MQEFASVGKSLMLQAIGIQENYTEVISSEIDTEKSGCYSCPCFYNADKSSCESCPSKCYITKKVYHNELNRHGYKPMLKLNAIRLLIYLHFLHPDANGIVRNVGFIHLAEKLDCDVRTIQNNLDILDKYDYIKYCRLDAKRINILIQDYTRAFKKASEGGTGFVVLNDTFMDKLLSIDKINTVRIYLRNLVELDTKNAKLGYSNNTLEKSYNEIRRSLPHYCKRGVIIKALSGNEDVFSVSHNLSLNTVTFILKEAYIGKECRNLKTNRYIKMLDDYITEFNHAAAAYNLDNKDKNNPFYRIFSFYPNVTPINLLPEHIDNMAHLAIEYSFEQVIEVFEYIYIYYYMEGTRIENLGGLIRTILNNKAYGYTVAQVLFCCPFF